MKILKYLGFEPKLNKSNFVADGAVIIGQSELGENVNVWFNTVIRGDVNIIKIGANTNVQDLSMLHVTEEHPLIIAENVSIGHSVILHGCEISKGCLIGMGAKVLDGVFVGENSIVAAGSVLPPGKKYPSGVMIMGAPAKVVRELRAEEIHSISNHYKSYLKTASEYMS